MRRMLKGNERRECIRKDLMKSLKAMKGAELAEKYGVSRQVIVQDIALLRAVGEQIVSTADGYIYFSFHMNMPKRVFAVKHDHSEIEKELTTILDLGGSLLNVFIHHPIYGDLVADMNIDNKVQMEKYIIQCQAEDFKPLMFLTDNVHYHTIEANSEKELDLIEAALSDLGYLYEDEGDYNGTTN